MAESDKQQLLEKVESNQLYSEKIGEVLIEILDKADDALKPQLIAKTFKAYISRKISFIEFRKITRIINNSYAPDLQLVNILILGQQLSKSEYGVLLNLGLVEIQSRAIDGAISLGGTGKHNIMFFSINDLGLLVNQVLYSN